MRAKTWQTADEWALMLQKKCWNTGATDTDTPGQLKAGPIQNSGRMEKRAKLAAHWHAFSDRDISMAIISLHLTPFHSIFIPSNVAMVFRVVDKQSLLLDFVAGPI